MAHHAQEKQAQLYSAEQEITRGGVQFRDFLLKLQPLQKFPEIQKMAQNLSNPIWVITMTGGLKSHFQQNPDGALELLGQYLGVPSLPTTVSSKQLAVIKKQFQWFIECSDQISAQRAQLGLEKHQAKPEWTAEQERLKRKREDDIIQQKRLEPVDLTAGSGEEEESLKKRVKIAENNVVNTPALSSSSVIQKESGSPVAALQVKQQPIVLQDPNHVLDQKERQSVSLPQGSVHALPDRTSVPVPPKSMVCTNH